MKQKMKDLLYMNRMTSSLITMTQKKLAKMKEITINNAQEKIT